MDVYDEASNSFHEFVYSYNVSETVDFGQESFTGTLERNATHLGFMVSVCAMILPPQIDHCTMVVDHLLYKYTIHKNGGT